ncbi:centractin- actin- protein of the dynactin complex, partial [Coemansia sp. RSA 2603]
KEVVRQIKEKTCYVALDAGKEEKEAGLAGRARGEVFRLPDGKEVRLGSERFQAAEILFRPELVGREDAGVHQMVADAIGRADMDLRRALYGSVVLSGGTTLMRGFGDRLLGELRRQAVKDCKIKISAPPERKYSTWIGGSILASLSTFKKMWVSAEEYQEDPDVIHKKFF